MTKKKVILVTGVADYWGAQVANRLIQAAGAQAESETDTGALYLRGSISAVIGMDVEPPAEEIKGLDFIQADVRNPLLAGLLQSEEVHTVCHLVFQQSSRLSEATFDINVMGTMKMLGACAEAGVQKVVLRSSMGVYGAHPDNPSFITEDYPLQGGRGYGYNRDLAEIEAFCNGFRHQTPEMILTILRFPSIVGTRADTPMTRFLKQPFAPTLLGFDPLMQVIHEKDVVDALVYAVLHDVPGVFNIAAEGILPLSRLTALAAKRPLPIFHPFAYWGNNLLDGARLRARRYFPIELDYIRYSCVGDLTKMKEELGFVPQYTAEEALREFAGEQRRRRYMPEAATLAYDEERLRDTLERRRRVREQDAAPTSDSEEASHD